ncbi:hypothetical protein ACIBCO_35100 [Streptomyces violascens]|uniref:hypothetical protein n=1 Tax=Streptomyces violascens TaxID=67381 RepID=UPI00379B468E
MCAAVFAVLCVLLAAGGHALAMGEAPSVWAVAVGCGAVFTFGFLLGGHERSLAGIGGAMAATQAGLHVLFDTSGPRAAMRTQVAHAGHAMIGMRMAQPHAMTPHATVAHAGAALLATWWLRRGEAALWSLLRRAVAFVPGLVAWWQVRSGLTAEPVEVGSAGRNGDEARTLWQVLLLRHAVHRRGPPPGISHAI